MAKIAAIGTDGNSLVVWGLGDNEESALHEAECNAADSDCSPDVCGYLPVTDAQVQLINEGAVHMSDLGLESGVHYRYHNGALTAL